MEGRAVGMANTWAVVDGKRITGTVDEVPVRNAPWPEAVRQWRVTLRCQGRRMSLDYYGGARAECDVAGVVESLEMDASGAGESFEDWSREYGYDVDSRKAEATYRAVVAQTRRFNRLIGR